MCLVMSLLFHAFSVEARWVWVQHASQSSLIMMSYQMSHVCGHVTAGVTMSMGKYDVSVRGRVLVAFKQFQALQQAMPGQVKLVLCTWLMPGVAEDLAYIQSQVKE